MSRAGPNFNGWDDLAFREDCRCKQLEAVCVSGHVGGCYHSNEAYWGRRDTLQNLNVFTPGRDDTMNLHLVAVTNDI